MSDLDYQRYGRQIALANVGAAGQRALATTGVHFVRSPLYFSAPETRAHTTPKNGEGPGVRAGDGPALRPLSGPGPRPEDWSGLRPDDLVARAEQLHRRAGGCIDDHAEIVLRLPRVRTVPAQLGVAAAFAIEAARRVLGQPPREIPEDLIAQLDEITP